jgi:Domain of unknown function (DUF4386)
MDNGRVGTEDRTLRARALLAGFLYLAVNAIYIASLLAGTAGPEAVRRPAVALQVIATAATITLAWSLYELVRPAGPGLALMALLFRVAEASIFGVLTVFSLLLLGGTDGTLALDDATRALLTQAQTASGQVGQIYFCPGSALFFYLMMKGRVVPRAIAVFGLVATIVWLAAGLVQIGAPALAGDLAFSGPVFLLAETATGGWLLYSGLRSTPGSAVA